MGDATTAGMESEPIASPGAISGPNRPIEPSGCLEKDGIGRPCQREAGHSGAHAVAMEPMELVYRETIRGLIVHRDRTAQRSGLLMEKQKVDLLLDNQAALLNGLAMLLDMGLQGAGLPGEIRVVAKGGNGRA